MKVGAILPHVRCFGGVRRFLEIGNEFIRRGIDYTIFARKERVCDWFDFRGKIEGCDNIIADFVFASYPPDFKVIPRVKGKVFVYVIAGGMYIEGYRKVYGRYPFILNNRVFRKWFKKSHLVEGGVNVHTFSPNSHSKSKKVRVLFYDKNSKGAPYIRKELLGLKNIELIGLNGLKNEELVKEYQRGDFFVSWESRPGWSNTSAEALSCGLTVVGNGVNCEPFVDRIIKVNSLRSFFSNPENLQKRRRYSMEDFSWEKVVDKLLEVFRKPYI